MSKPLDEDWNSIPRYEAVPNELVKPSHVVFGKIKVSCTTGEVTGLSENITGDAKLFWEQVKEYIIGK